MRKRPERQPIPLWFHLHFEHKNHGVHLQLINFQVYLMKTEFHHVFRKLPETPFSFMAYADDAALIESRINFRRHLCFVTDLFLPNVIYDLSTGSNRFFLIRQQDENRCSGLRLQNSPHVFPYNLFQFCQPAWWWLITITITIISLDPMASRSGDSAYVLITLFYGSSKGQYFCSLSLVPIWPWEAP